MPAIAPRPRSPAQIEASRRNGARSRGPVTPEGKAKASRNALKHGLAALHHFVLEDETPSELEELTARLLAECAPESEIEARLVRRMAIAFWKGERAERIEVALFDAAPKLRPPQAGFEWEEADPLTTFDLKRFNAVRGYQAQQGRELSRCLKELRMLRREQLAECTGEPETASRKEPERPPFAANDDASIAHTAADRIPATGSQNKPEPAPLGELPEPAQLRTLAAQIEHARPLAVDFPPPPRAAECTNEFLQLRTNEPTTAAPASTTAPTSEPRPTDPNEPTAVAVPVPPSLGADAPRHPVPPVPETGTGEPTRLLNRHQRRALRAMARQRPRLAA